MVLIILKTDHFFLSTAHKYNSYYYYFADDILADKEKISREDAREILKNEEEKWINDNNIDLNLTEDISKNIEYRNKIFLRESI